MHPIIVLGFRVAFVISILLMTLATLSKPDPNVHGILNDKLAHILGFFVLAFVTHCAFPKSSIAKKLIFLICYGMAIEIAQSFTGYRHFSWLDWLADIAGVLAFQPLAKPTLDWFASWKSE
ncbi:MAG: VanZ family protein [Pseudomonadales bacterium]|nr:VanZ family protein [Pseudomonadales bacterium]